MKKIILLFAMVFSALLSSCEDPAPMDYTKDYVVEGVLIVGEPIRDIKILQTQALADSFHYENQFGDFAKVIITDSLGVYQLKYRWNADNGYGEYYFQDSSILVKANTKYKLTVEIDSNYMYGETYTPEQIYWTARPHHIMQYPKDTLELLAPDSLNISWTKAPSSGGTILCIKSLDTSEYGKYLSPPTAEANSRIYRWNQSKKEDDPQWLDLSVWTILMSNTTSVVWQAFKWYGRNEVSIYASDINYFNWFKMIQFSGNPNYQSSQGSIKNGKGVFGSLSVIKDTSFLLKN